VGMYVLPDILVSIISTLHRQQVWLHTKLKHQQMVVLIIFKMTRLYRL